MKVGLIIHDHDTATLFLDGENLPPEARIYELTLKGVPFEEIGDEEVYLWVQDTSKYKLEVVEKDGFDPHTMTEERCVVPVPIICLDKDDPYFTVNET